jgi:kynureninase
MGVFMTMEQLKNWFQPEEKLLQKQNRILAKLANPVQINETTVLNTGTVVKIVCRMDHGRFAITSDLNRDISEGIVSESSLKDIHTE